MAKRSISARMFGAGAALILAAGVAAGQQREIRPGPSGLAAAPAIPAAADSGATKGGFTPEELMYMERTLGTTYDAEARRVLAEKLFGVYTPEGNDSYLFFADPMDEQNWSGQVGVSGGGQPYLFDVYHAVEAPLPAEVRSHYNDPNLRGGIMMLSMSTSTDEYAVVWWVYHQNRFGMRPLATFANRQEAGQVAQALYELRSSGPRLWSICTMDSIAAATWDTFIPTFEADRDAEITGGVITMFACGIGAGLTCGVTPILPIPAGPACLATVGCTATAAVCATRSAVVSAIRADGYRRCLCAQSAQRAAGGPVGTCKPAEVATCY